MKRVGVAVVLIIYVYVFSFIIISSIHKLVVSFQLKYGCKASKFHRHANFDFHLELTDGVLIKIFQAE